MPTKRKQRKKHNPRPRVDNNLTATKKIVKMPYCTSLGLNPGPGGVISHVFRANSIYDPDYTGVGHQPLTHDQYELFYEEYRVVRAELKVTPIAVNGTTQTPGVWGAFVDADPVFSYSTSTACIEDKERTKSWKIHSGIQGALYNDNYSLPIKRVFNAKKFLTPDGAENGVPFGSNPASGEYSAYFQIWAGSPDNSNDPGTLYYMVEIDYYVELTSPKVVSQS